MLTSRVAHGYSGARSNAGLAAGGWRVLLIAVKACADALVGKTCPEELYEAILRAANEAGISALSLVQDVTLRDGWLEPPQSLQGQ